MRRRRGDSVAARNVTCNLDSSRSSTNTWIRFRRGRPIVQSTDPNLVSTGSSQMSRIARRCRRSNAQSECGCRSRSGPRCRRRSSPIATSDCRCVDELHVLASVDAADRLRAALLKPGVTSALANRCKQLGIAQADIAFSQQADDSRSRSLRDVRFNRRRRPRHPSEIMWGHDERRDCGRFVKCWYGRYPGAFGPSTGRQAHGQVLCLARRSEDTSRFEASSAPRRPWVSTSLVGSPRDPRRTTHAANPFLYGVGRGQALGPTATVSAGNTHSGRQAPDHQD